MQEEGDPAVPQGKYPNLYRYVKELAINSSENAEKTYQYLCNTDEQAAELYEEVIESREDEKVNYEDCEIECMNKQRNILPDLTKEEEILYEFSQKITKGVLKDMSKKSIMKQPVAYPSEGVEKVSGLVQG